MNASPYGGLTARTAVADALLTGVSGRLADAEVRAVLDCGFDATLAAARSTHHLTDWQDFPWRRAL